MKVVRSCISLATCYTHVIVKIGIIASIWIKIPPDGFGFGSQESLAYYLAEGLKKKGHEVTLFTTADTTVDTKVVSIAEKQVSDLQPADNKIKDIFELMNVSQAYKMADSFDIIHNHLLPYAMLFNDIFRKPPTVHTLHHKIYHPSDLYMYKKYKDQNFITISDAQRKIMPELNYIATVYNGIDPDFYSFQEQPQDDYLLCIGRLKRYKGMHTAIKLAKKMRVKLKIATRLPNPSQPDYEEVSEYWEQEVKPQLGGDIEYVGAVQGKEKITLLQNAKALIIPIEWEEPFGMTVIEAMSCGTPVVAYAMGAIPELIANNKTGFLVDFPDGFDGLDRAVQRLYSMPKTEYLEMRKACRVHTENSFTVQKMVDAYESVYQKYL